MIIIFSICYEEFSEREVRFSTIAEAQSYIRAQAQIDIHDNFGHLSRIESIYVRFDDGHESELDLDFFMMLPTNPQRMCQRAHS